VRSIPAPLISRDSTGLLGTFQLVLVESRTNSPGPNSSTANPSPIFESSTFVFSPSAAKRRSGPGAVRMCERIEA